MKENVFSYIKSDLARICEPTFINFVKIYFFPRGEMFRYDVWFRIVQFAKHNKLSRILIGIPAYVVLRRYEFKYGIHANTNIPVGKGLHIVHGDGVYLNCKSIGENFTCYQGVTLGLAHNEVPTVESNVTIFAGGGVFGNVVLHEGCTIGAMSFVNKNVDNNDIVVGIPAKSIKK